MTTSLSVGSIGNIYYAEANYPNSTIAYVDPYRIEWVTSDSPPVHMVMSGVLFTPTGETSTVEVESKFKDGARMTSPYDPAWYVTLEGFEGPYVQSFDPSTGDRLVRATTPFSILS